MNSPSSTEQNLSAMEIPFHSFETPFCRLGSGQFGRVYEGVYQGNTIAFKIMKHAIHQSFFFNEVHILHRLSHPHIPRLYGYSISKEDKIFCILMEKARGIHLYDLLCHYDLTPSHKLDIGRQLLETISYLHLKCILYRDLKPENIIISPVSKRMTLVDFGLAVQLENEHSFTDGIAGTPGYMAPEVQNGLPYSFSADIFSYGMVLYFLFTECEHTRPTIFIQRMRKHVPPSLRSFILSCIRYRPEERPSTPALLLDVYPPPSTVMDSIWMRFWRWLSSLHCFSTTNLE